jgi:hypothetical protein
MTQGNFDWFLHAMLFYHTLKVIERQQKSSSLKRSSGGDSDSDSDSDGDDSDSNSLSDSSDSSVQLA